MATGTFAIFMPTAISNLPIAMICWSLRTLSFVSGHSKVCQRAVTDLYAMMTALRVCADDGSAISRDIVLHSPDAVVVEVLSGSRAIAKHRLAHELGRAFALGQRRESWKVILVTKSPLDLIRLLPLAAIPW
jgi:hypothetical protein